MNRPFNATCWLALATTLVASLAHGDDAGSPASPGTSAARELGVEYRLRKLSTPRPNRVHVLRIDLSRGRVMPRVVASPDPDGDGPAEAVLTNPLDLARERSVVAFINTNPWDALPDDAGKRNRRWFAGQPVDVRSLVASGGNTRSPANNDDASAWVDESSRVRLGKAPSRLRFSEGLAGFSMILRDGKIIAPLGGPRHPRTAIGVDRSGRVLWLVVVDGRQQGFSEGMTLEELGKVLRDLGCWTATNLDGGGSSVMGLRRDDGKLHVVNSPSGRRNGKVVLRPVPTILTIREEAPRVVPRD